MSHAFNFFFCCPSTRFGGASSDQPMPSFARAASFEFVILPWSEDLAPERLQQLADVLFKLSAAAWGRVRVKPVLDEFMLDVGFVKCFELPGDDDSEWTPIPQEGSDYWARPVPGPSCVPVIIAIRTIPEEHLVVNCNIRASRSIMTIQYVTMSGSPFGDPVHFSTKKPVLMRDLVAHARRVALCKGTLRSHHQNVRVLIHGNPKTVPNHYIVWSEHVHNKPPRKRLRCKTDLSQKNLNFKLAEIMQ